MNDADFIQEMQQGLPPIKPPAGLSTVDCTDLLLANTDIEINHHEAIHGICAQGETDGD